MTMIPDLRPLSRPVSIPLFLGLFIGSLSIGRQGIYFALVTLAFGWAMSGEVVMMALSGGMHTVFGPWRGHRRHHTKLFRQLGRLGYRAAGRDLRHRGPVVPRAYRESSGALAQKPL